MSKTTRLRLLGASLQIMGLGIQLTPGLGGTPIGAFVAGALEATGMWLMAGLLRP